MQTLVCQAPFALGLVKVWGWLPRWAVLTAEWRSPASQKWGQQHQGLPQQRVPFLNRLPCLSAAVWDREGAGWVLAAPCQPRAR